MKLFINDILVNVVKPEEFSPSKIYHQTYEGNELLLAQKLAGDVLIYDANPTHIDELITLMEVKKLRKLSSVTVVTEDYKGVKDFIKEEFKVVKAGGGLVLKDGKFLMIHRLGRWDLPKGKLEREEKSLEGALREVNEECNVDVVGDTKLVSTWHTYVDAGRRSIKKTTWYLMTCTNADNMAPQHQEGIDKVEFKSLEEVHIALQTSYGSIREVFSTYFSQQHTIASKA